METKWVIDTPDGHRIYGCKNTVAGDSDAAIFMVHGLTGHMHEYAFKRAADELSHIGDVYRFNLYDGVDGARQLTDCTLQTHADDLNAVIAHFAGAYEKVFLIGHSYGGPTIMMARPEKVTAVSLWDPSFDIKTYIAPQFHPHGDLFVTHWGVSSLIGTNMAAEAQRLDRTACINLAQSFGHPVQVIHAADGLYVHDDVSYHSFGHPDNIREIVERTEHCFFEDDSCDVLLAKTAAWFGRFNA